MIGAILIETRPDRISRSAWRGEKRITSAPKRDRSFRGEPITVIISIAQQARPKPSGNSAFLRAQFCAFSNLVKQQPLLDLALEVLALELAAQQLLGLQLADAQAVAVDLGARHFHSSAPLRQTNTNATSSSTTNTIVSTSANTPNASSCTATG